MTFRGLRLYFTDEQCKISRVVCCVQYFILPAQRGRAVTRKFYFDGQTIVL